MRVQLFDVDGTLTYSEKDHVNNTKYPSFAFWPLLTFKFCNNPTALRTAIHRWEMSMKTAVDPDQSSFEMMAHTVREFLPDTLTSINFTDYAKKITYDFLAADVIRLEAINYLKECLDNGILCILTTGSYLEGLHGFVQALQAENLLPSSNNLLLNGAEIDWDRKSLRWPNIGAYKTRKIYETLQRLGIEDYQIQAAFGDDPYVNDKGILAMAEQGFVIKCHKNAHEPFNEKFIHCTWDDFLKNYQEKFL
jgi:hypothetical protein